MVKRFNKLGGQGFSPDQPDTLFVYDRMQFQERNR